MSDNIHRLRAQLAVLKDVAEEYPTCSVQNAIRQISSRIEEIKSHEL